MNIVARRSVRPETHATFSTCIGKAEEQGSDQREIESAEHFDKHEE